MIAVHPGASSSTVDVFNGLTKALDAQGHEIIPFRLDGRLDSFNRWLNWQWRRAGKPDPRPTVEDVYYQASVNIIERALWHVPDWVVCFSGAMVHPNVFRMLRRMGCPTAIILTETPYLPEIEMDLAKWATVAFTNERSAVDKFREVQPHTYYLPHAYDPDIHYPSEPLPEDDTPAHDVVFVGTGFIERIELLAGVDWSGIDLGLYGLWDLLGSRSKLRQYLRGGETPNWRTVQLYRRAKIGLNLYRSSMGFGRGVEHVFGAECMNPRAYELAACGVFQLSEDRAEVAEVFPDHVPTFRTSDELEMLIRDALPDPTWRAYLADEARKDVRHETFWERAKFITKTLDTVARDRALRIVSRDGINPTATVSAG